MFKVSPIGSCRITTPLRHGHASYGIHLNLDRCYGYCHSPAEAVQMARFMQGNASIPADIWPLVSRSHKLETISAQPHAPSDLYVVELASAKEVTIDGVSIQLNYLNSTFAEFFGDPSRAQEFWACAGNDDATAMSDFLNKEWADTPQHRKEAETLARIRLQFVTRESLRDNIRTLKQLLPDILLVSHIDARKLDGSPIRSRSEFIQMVACEARQAGCKFYNPTDLMGEFGQQAAIEDESTGLAHFTKAFSDAVMEDWMRQFIAPKTDAAVRAGVDGALDREFQPQMIAAFKDGRFADAIARLDTLVAEVEHVAAHRETAEQNRQTAQRVFIDTTLAKAQDDLTDDDRNQLVAQAGDLGLFQTALDLAVQAPDGLQSLPTYTLLQVANRSRNAGDTDNAFEFFLAAVAKDQNQTRANAALVELAVNEEVDLLAELESDQAANLMAHLDPVQSLQLLELNGAPFTDVLSDRTNAKELADIVRYLEAHYGVGHGADVLASWRHHRQADRITDPGLVKILDQWVRAALGTDDLIDRLNRLNTILHAAPRHRTARNALRDTRKELVRKIRDAGRHNNIDALDALADEVAALKTDLPEFDLWRARLRYRLEDYGTALELGQSAAAHLPETINVWVLLMRAAAKAKNSAKAIEFARKVIDLTCAETEKLKTEAEALLESHAVEA